MVSYIMPVFSDLSVYFVLVNHGIILLMCDRLTAWYGWNILPCNAVQPTGYPNISPCMQQRLKYNYILQPRKCSVPKLYQSEFIYIYIYIYILSDI